MTLYEGPADLVVQCEAIIRHCGYMGSSNVFCESVGLRAIPMKSDAEPGPAQNEKGKGKGPCKSTV